MKRSPVTTIIWFCFLCLCLNFDCFAAPPVGGGFLEAGLRGSYFANPDLEGVPSFTRKDPRIDFHWGSVIAPGGSRGTGFNAVGTDHFSVRWTGQFQSRFSETYTFTVVADDGVRLRVRNLGNGNWSNVIDVWNGSGLSTNSGVFACSATNTLELELDYRETTGEARVQLFWSSASVPMEIVEPAFEVSLNWVTYEEVTFADAFMNGRGGWEGTPVDAQGWPVGDGDFIVSEINAPHAPSPLEVGRMHLSFNGRADVSVFGNGFIIPGTYLYEPARNRSTAEVQGQDFGANVLNLRFRNTSRTGVDGGPAGVTNVKLMRPTPGNVTQPLPDGELFHPATRQTFADRLTSLRFQRVNDQAREWNERTPPWWPYQGAGISRPFVYASRYGMNHEGRARTSHEYEIMLCNETGTDYFVTVPHLASVTGTTNYLRRLAQLIRHGSNQQGMPYEQPTAQPYYPPLNPNLRVYLEISNELWNFLDRGTYSPYWDYRELMEDMADANTLDFQILNYDGLSMAQEPNGYYVNNYTWVRRYWALKLKQMGDEFRAVFGNEAMPGAGPQPRIRPYLGYQYANANNTADIPFNFLDGYFNNGSGNFVAEPRPANHYIHAAGGAGYYGSGNPSGSTWGLIPNSSFENPVIEQPSVSSPAGWSFSGNAGLTRNAPRTPAVLGESIASLRNNFSGWVGMRFTVGATPVWAYDLGRYVHAGNNRSHALVLIRNSDGQLVSYAQAVSGGTPGTYNFSRCVPVLLQANTSYSVLTEEEVGYDMFGDENSVVTAAGAEVAIDGAVTGTPGAGNIWTLQNASAGSVSFGPVNLRFAPASELGNPDAYHGSQVAYVGNAGGQNGALEISFTAPPGSGNGVYGLAFRAVQRARESSVNPDTMTLRITVNGSDITFRGINGQPQGYSPFFPWQRVSYWIGEYFFTETFSVAAGAPITLRIEGTATGTDAQLCFLDDLQLTSVDALFAGGVPDTGQATGQPAGGNYIQGLRMDARWAHSFGMHHMTYEHGWSIGGDSGASPVQEFAKFRDPRAAQTMIEALDIFHRAGGANLTLGTYTTWPLFAESVREEGVLNPGAWPLVQGLDFSWRQLPAPSDNGVQLPGILHAANRSIGYASGDNRVSSGEWVSWNIIVPERAEYQIQWSFTGEGMISMTLDESEVIHSGNNSSPMQHTRNLFPGLHTLKVKALTGTTFLSGGIAIGMSGSPASPLLTGTDGDALVHLSWNAVPSASSYVLRYGPEPNFPSRILEVGNITSFAVAGLSNTVPYYFTVAARNDSGLSLPSNQLGITPFADNQVVDLVAWNFAGQSGDAASAAPGITSSRVIPSSLIRGPGFLPAGWAPLDCFLGAANSWAQDLQGAVVNHHYVEFSLSPMEGRSVSIASLNFRPSFQNLVGGPADPRGVGIAWRIGNRSMTDPVPVAGLRSPSFNNGTLYSADLAGVDALQNVREDVTFRIYFHGMGPFEGGALGGPGNDLYIVGSLQSQPLLLWRELNGLRGDGADDDAIATNDGIPNLLKYAFNLQPLNEPVAQRLLLPNGTAGLPNCWLENGIVYFQFVRLRSQTNPGIDYEAVWSNDLGAWATVTTQAGVEVINSVWERVTFSTPATGTQQFFQVNVRLAP